MLIGTSRNEKFTRNVLTILVVYLETMGYPSSELENTRKDSAWVAREFMGRMCALGDDVAADM